MKKIFIRLFIACCLAYVFTTIGFNNSSIKQFLNLDLVEYFVSGNVIRERGNPYSYDIQTVEQCTKNLEYKDEWGVKKPECPTMFYNPPIALTPSILISYIRSYKVASYIWSFFIIFIYLCCFFILYDLFANCPKNNLTNTSNVGKLFNNFLFLMTVFTFKPFIDNIFFGQISFLLLLGLTLSIYFEKHGKTFWSAFFLSLTSIKPHPLYLYYFFWFFYDVNKGSKIKGFLTGIFFFSILPLVYNPHIYSYYISFMSSNLPTTKWFSATISAWINHYIPFSSSLIAFLPAILTIFVCSLYLFKLKIKHVSLHTRVFIIIPLSLFTMAYGWGFDMITLLPTLCVYYCIISSEINVNQRNKIILFGYLILIDILFVGIEMEFCILFSLFYLLFSCYLIILKSKRKTLEGN